MRRRTIRRDPNALVRPDLAAWTGVMRPLGSRMVASVRRLGDGIAPVPTPESATPEDAGRVLAAVLREAPRWRQIRAQAQAVRVPDDAKAAHEATLAWFAVVAEAGEMVQGAAATGDAGRILAALDGFGDALAAAHVLSENAARELDALGRATRVAMIVGDGVGARR